MTLDELNKIDVNDPAQVKALQNFLKSRGYYSKGIDGKWGGDTIEAVKSLRGDLQTEAQTNLRSSEVGLKTAETNLQAEQQKSSWSRFGQEFGPYAAGGGLGALGGAAMMRANKASDTGLAKEAERMLTDKRVTSPVVAEKTLDSRLNARRWRTGKQALGAPAAAFALADVTRRYVKPSTSEEIQPYIDLAASMEQGVGGGVGALMIKDAFSSKNPVPADVEAAIRSRAAEARGDPYTVSGKAKAATPAANAPDPARMAELRAKRAADLRTEAKAAGLHVSGTKEDLVRRLADAPAQTAKPKRLPKAGLLAPFAAGAIAYDAATEDAEAAGLSEMATQGRGAAAGAGAAGLTVGAAKLAPYAANAISKSALGRVALRAVPPAAAALTAYDIGNYMAQGATPAPENDAFAEQYAKTHPRFDPDEARTARMSARQAVRMPMENASSLDVPNIRPGAAVTAERNAVANSGDFDAMLAEFVRAVEEHNAGVGNYGP
jgi:hypothetical protein